MEYILTQSPKQVVEDAILAAMLTERIPRDFAMSSAQLENLYVTIEGFISRQDADGLVTTVTSFIVGYACGWRDANHPNKTFTNYSDKKSE